MYSNFFFFFFFFFAGGGGGGGGGGGLKEKCLSFLNPQNIRIKTDFRVS